MGIFNRKIKESGERSLLLLRNRKAVVSGLGELGNSAFWACVMQLAKLYATLPWDAYIKDGKGNRKEASLALKNLLDEPNKWMTSYEFRFIMALNFELHGEAYALIERTQRGVPAYMIPVPTGAMITRINDNGDIVYNLNGTTYMAEDVLAIRQTPSGITTVLSPAAFAKSDLDLEAKCKEMQMEYFDGASVIGNLIKVPSSLTPEQKEQIKTGFDTTNGFRNIVIDNRVDVTPIQVNSADVSKLVEAQKWTSKQVAARFGVPGFFVGITDGAYNNLEDQNMYFMTYCLNPRLRAWEEALKRALCKGGEYIEFNREGLLQANSAAKVQFYNAALNNGWMNRNEIRAKENLPNLGEDGDVFFMQSAMATVDRIIAGTDGNSGGFNPWNAPQEDAKPADPVKEEAPAKLTIEETLEEKKAKDRRFVEEATKQAKTARRALENEFASQLKEELDRFRGYYASGMDYESALGAFSQDLNVIGDLHKDTYFKIYRGVADKLKPVIKKQVQASNVQDVQNQPLDEFISQYVDSLMGRHAGFMYKRMEKKAVDLEGFEAEAEHLQTEYPYAESNEEVNRSSNALSLFMFSALDVTTYHIVADADSCAFCEGLDGKVASVNGYVLSKGDTASDGIGGVRKIDKNYRHPPFHLNCRCHIAPGE